MTQAEKDRALVPLSESTEYWRAAAEDSQARIEELEEGTWELRNTAQWLLNVLPVMGQSDPSLDEAKEALEALLGKEG